VTDSGAPPTVDAGPCVPGSVQAFTPLYQPPRFEVACARADIDLFYNACLSNDATQAACDAQGAAAPTCSRCLFTDATDAMWGATVAYGTSTSVNLAGCLSALGGAGLSGCAHALAFQDGCEHAACDKSMCPSQLASDACVAQADLGACKQYVDSANAQCPAQLPAEVSPCTQGATFEASFKAVAVALCGPN
jgi:hypothetical protein